MKIALLAALLLSAETNPDPFCSEIKALRAGSEESPPFGSLAGRDFYILLGSYCRMSNPAATAWLCTRQLAPDGVSKDIVTAKIAACLADATVVKGVNRYESDMVRAGRLSMRISESGGPRAHVGRIVTLHFERAD